MEYTMTLPENHPPMPLRDLLEREWLVPRKVRHFLRTRKNVTVNQQPAMFHQEVRGGDQITLVIEDSDYSYQPIQLGQANKVDVLFEDEHLLVLNKPAGVKTHPNQPLEADTLLNDAAAYLAPKQQQPYVVHRLDKETSGVVLFAKILWCCRSWAECWKTNRFSAAIKPRFGANLRKIKRSPKNRS